MLSGLARTGPRNAADLAAVIGLDRSGVSRHASRLEAAGLVRREPTPATGARCCSSSPSAGAAAVEEMRRRFAERVAAALASLAAGEAEAFARGLRRFAEEGPF